MRTAHPTVLYSITHANAIRPAKATSRASSRNFRESSVPVQQSARGLCPKSQRGKTDAAPGLFDNSESVRGAENRAGAAQVALGAASGTLLPPLRSFLSPAGRQHR